MQIPDIKYQQSAQEGLRVKKNFWFIHTGTQYEPEYLPITLLVKETDIDRQTILAWCRDSKIKSEYGVCNKKGIQGRPTMVHVQDFVNYVLYKYRYRKFKGVGGKWWTDAEMKDIQSTARSPIAKRVMKCRAKKVCG